MTQPVNPPASYLPPELRDHLRLLLAATPDPRFRAHMAAFGEMCFQRGNAFGYDGGYLDGRAEAAAQPSGGGPITNPGHDPGGWYDAHKQSLTIGDTP